MAKSELIAAIEQVCDEKNIPFDSVVDSIEAALAVAYRKEFGNKMLNCRVEFNPEDGSSRIFDVKTVVEDPKEEDLAAQAEEEKKKAEEAVKGKRRERRGRDEEKSEPAEDDVKRFNPRTDLSLTEAKKVKADAEIGDEMISELPVPEGYGRVAAQTAKQVIIQKLREAERETLYNQYKDRIGEIVNATVQRVEGPLVYMDLGQATAIMPPNQQSPNERYHIGARFKVLLLSVEKTNKGPEIIASRTAPEMVKVFFAMEVPEIASESIEIMSVAREAGSRTKIAVRSLVDNIDPIGSCVGQRGARVQTVMSEIGGEKIDIIEYSDDAVRFIVNALSPAKVVSVQLDEAEKVAKAYVAEDQLSLAIGKGGQNVRLAAKLTGWKIDVVKDASSPEAENTEEAVGESETETPTEEVTVEPMEEKSNEVEKEKAAESEK
ncbi:MAG: transcription termination/antitermination protein NusA [Candidatus Kerfeldbacteria bacterium]|nr:transcription termination/antitermination protein NusA [Candidatus Kerfeldbacteria bacterium]